MILRKASKRSIVYSCKNFHYSQKPPALNGTAFSVFNDNNEWCGCIIYGSGANPQIGTAYGLKQGQIFELVRMALNGKQESTSKALALSLKLLKKRCPTLKAVVSYADKGQKHLGTIYQATNWYYVGQTESSSTEFYYKGKWEHSRSIGALKRNKGLDTSKLERRKASGKIKYMYPLYKEQRDLFEKICKPYPKKLSIDGVKVAHHTTSMKEEAQYLPQCSN